MHRSGRGWRGRGLLVLGVAAACVAGMVSPAYAADPPTITTAFPKVADVGATVTVRGSGFSTTAAQNTVTVNGVAVSLTQSRVDQLKFTVPAGRHERPCAGGDLGRNGAVGRGRVRAAGPVDGGPGVVLTARDSGRRPGGRPRQRPRARLLDHGARRGGRTARSAPDRRHVRRQRRGRRYVVADGARPGRCSGAWPGRVHRPGTMGGAVLRRLLGYVHGAGRSCRQRGGRCRCGLARGACRRRQSGRTGGVRCHRGRDRARAGHCRDVRRYERAAGRVLFVGSRSRTRSR